MKLTDPTDSGVSSAVLANFMMHLLSFHSCVFEQPLQGATAAGGETYHVHFPS